MIYKYEMACKEAGLSEEQTAEIRRFFDAEKKRLKRDKEVREEEGITFSYIVTSEDESEEAGDLDSREIADEGFNLEELIIHKLELEKLDKVLKELPEDDREFLLSLFSYGSGGVSKFARARGVPRETVRDRKQSFAQSSPQKNFLKKIEKTDARFLEFRPHF